MFHVPECYLVASFVLLQFWDSLERELNDDYHGAAVSVDDIEHGDDQTGASAPDNTESLNSTSGTIKRSTSAVTNVIVASSSVLVSTGVSGIDIGGSDLLDDQCVAAGLGSRLTANGLISPEDRKRLLRYLTAWKEKEPGRGCLVACALKMNGTNDRTGISERTRESFSDGWIISYGEGMSTTGQRIIDDKDDDGACVLELRLRFILVGSMSNRPSSLGDNGSLLTHDFGDVGATAYKNALLQMIFENGGESELSVARKKRIVAEWMTYGYAGFTNTITPPGVSGFVKVSIAAQDHTHASVQEMTAGALSTEMHQSFTINHGTRKDEITYDVRCVSTADIQQQPAVVIGPLIGGLTPTSAIIVCEYGAGRSCARNTSAVSVTAVDQISGMEYVCRRKVTIGKPIVFNFQGLTENTTYAVVIQDIAGGTLQLGGVSVSSRAPTDIRLHSRRWRIGTFTTPSVIPVHVLATQMHKLALKSLKIRMVSDLEEPAAKASDVKSIVRAIAARTVATAVAESCKVAAQKKLDHIRIEKSHDTAAVASKKAKSVSRQSSGAVPLKRNTSVSIAKVSGSVAANTKSDIHKDLKLQLDALESQTVSKLAAVRILVVGPNRPSWRQHVAEGLWHGYEEVFPSTEHISTADKGSESALTADLAHILQGDRLCNSIAGLLQNSWSGVDLVLHCGGNVDFNTTLDSVMTALARAEFATSSLRQRELLVSAEELMRNVYRLHWGTSSTMSSMFSQGSHLCCFSGSMADLLDSTHYSSLAHLANDYSQVLDCHKTLQSISDMFIHSFAWKICY